MTTMDTKAAPTKEYVPDRTSSQKRCLPRVIKKNLLLILTLAGVLLGFAVGFAVRETSPSSDTLMWIGLPGKLYLRMLKMMIVPLIICGVIAGTASLDPKSNGKITLVSFLFISITNGIGALLGTLSTMLFRPGGISTNVDGDEPSAEFIQTQDIFADLFRNIFPDNLFTATFQQAQTKYKVETSNSTNGSVVVSFSRTLGTTDGANILGLILACTLLGIAAGTVKERAGRAFLDFFSSALTVVIIVVKWFVWMTPIGVVSLIATSIASISDIAQVFAQLGLFIAAITVGIFVQQVIVMPLILFAFTRRNPYLFLWRIARPWMISFAAASTAVAIPEMFHSCEVRNKIDKRVVQFVVPFSVTLSANGSAVFIAGACIFITNLTGTYTSITEAIVIWLLTTVASLAIPSVPSSSIVTVVMILTSLGTPVHDIALLLTVEWYLDRIRTTSSVVSHCVCAAVVFRLCKTDLATLDKRNCVDMDMELVVIEPEPKYKNKQAIFNGVPQLSSESNRLLEKDKASGDL